MPRESAALYACLQAMANTHTPLARVLHWSFIGLYLYGLSKQLDDLEDLEEPGLLGFESFARDFAVLGIKVETETASPSALGCHERGPGSEKRIEYQIGRAI